MKNFDGLIPNFTPSWFASVMGTGILAIVSYFYSTGFPWLKGLATAVWILNMFLFGLLVVPWVLKFIWHSKKALADFREPLTGQFYATMPIACLVIAADLLIVGTDSLGPHPAIGMAKIIWIMGAVLSVLGAVVIPLLNFTNREVQLENINPAWFMPPVALIVIPVPGAKLIAYWPESWQLIMLIFNYVAWGSGFFLFIALEAICLYRFFCCPPLPGKLVPTVWINLGPIGVGTIALLNLAASSTPFLGQLVEPVLQILALFLWGFGFWWIICAICLTTYYLRNNDLPFSLAWWAFTFPLGAYTGATYLVATFLHSSFVYGYGFLCYLLLLTLWSIVLVRTLVGVKKMEFF
ncbi:tellurite-resistance/dicarboxylate transporter [Desulfoscipio gibsoniae]|uniref:C4-dicarboxylate transporter/malic acid transport protein n=1 Tax=Desulfoscipio gibsoniae DSM 7213 TaxID=767817 RepID=R4KLP5_9FIRM|nr:tellurite-resistance/dicarboxylate transporter [Desulfoscipio gibsoniae]AGL02482.1 C4-dicarboxylate transporter/malic acid transport protein [Desulfoscipio gibsoniae DSM 7213]